jgi:ACS family pantothenate transporter-like MFS transporter
MFEQPGAWRNFDNLTICRKEDLGMYGNELNYATTAFTVGYIVGEIPSNILLTRIRPSIYIPSLQVCRETFTTLSWRS